MKILVLGARNSVTALDRQYYQQYTDFFLASAATTEIDLQAMNALVSDLIIRVGDGVFTISDVRNGIELNNYDAIFLRSGNFGEFFDLVAVISEYAGINNIPIINDYAGVRNSSKLLQAVNFHSLNVPVAQTLFIGASALPTSNVLDNWQFPCIMKATHASHGNHNYVVNNIDDVQRIYQQNAGIRFVLQRFVPNNGDYRILMVGDDVLVIKRLAVDGSHLNNTSQGGEAQLVDINDLPEIIINQSKQIMQHLKMTIGGIDVIIDKNTGQHFFLEVNTQPQLMTGAFLDEKKKLVGKLLNNLNR